MDLLGTLKYQLQQLRAQAETIDLQPGTGKPQNWFDSALFSCRWRIENKTNPALCKAVVGVRCSARYFML